MNTILVADLRGRSQHASESQVKSHLKEEADTVATKPENRLLYANGAGFSILERLDHMIRTAEIQTREIQDHKREFKDQVLEFEKFKKESQSEKRVSKKQIEALENGVRKSKNQIDALQSGVQVSKNQIEALESEAQESKTKSTTQDNSLAALEARVSDLSLTSEGYLDIRMRFLDNYNKKVKLNSAFQHTLAIEAGNRRAHEGDAVTDATLFREEQGGEKRREDPETYKELYGVDHSMTLDIGT